MNQINTTLIIVSLKFRSQEIENFSLYLINDISKYPAERYKFHYEEKNDFFSNDLILRNYFLILNGVENFRKNKIIIKTEHESYTTKDIEINSGITNILYDLCFKSNEKNGIFKNPPYMEHPGKIEQFNKMIDLEILKDRKSKIIGKTLYSLDKHKKLNEEIEEIFKFMFTIMEIDIDNLKFVFKRINFLDYPLSKLPLIIDNYKVSEQMKFLKNIYLNIEFHDTKLEMSFVIFYFFMKNKEYEEIPDLLINYNHVKEIFDQLINFKDDPKDPSRTQIIQTSLFKWIPSVTYQFNF